MKVAAASVQMKTDTPACNASQVVIEFPAGIPGFENCRHFVLITSPDLSPLQCLQAVDVPNASFLAIDPTLIDESYDLTLREFERFRIAAGRDPLLWLALVTVAGEDATVNLRAPIVINPTRMLGCQFIRDDRDYPVHLPLNLG